MFSVKLQVLIIKKVLLPAAALFFIVSCSQDVRVKPELPADDVRLVVPSNFPPPVYNFSGNPLTKEGFVLGRKLFYEPRLSRDNTISCGSCHQQFAAFAHFEHHVSHGIDGLLGNRNSPGLYNLLWQTSFMWDGGVNHIEVQPLAPIANPVEMDETMPNIIAKLKADALYRKMFADAYGDDTINSQRILRAMAQFMGMLNSYNSRYDKYIRGEAGGTMSTEELNGLSLVRQKCTPCHQEPFFTDGTFRNNGLPFNPALNDIGRMQITMSPSDSMKFKVPSLRNVGLTGLFMHDGRFTTLQQVLNHYSTGLVQSSTLDPQLAGGILLTAQEKSDIVRFLQTLNDYEFITDERFADPN